MHGTGPRLFRRVYDNIAQDWHASTPVPNCFTQVGYNGSVHNVAVAAYADDLARVEAAQQAGQVEQCAVEHTAALERALRPHRLKLNLSKSECLLAVRGKGSYSAAKRVFSGDWSGPALKHVVKVLGSSSAVEPFSTG